MYKAIIFLFLLLLSINGVFAWQSRKAGIKAETKECIERTSTNLCSNDIGSAILSGTLMLIK